MYRTLLKSLEYVKARRKGHAKFLAHTSVIRKVLRKRKRLLQFGGDAA